ncbi:MAG TPA: anti-sigma regulatory factor [Usitatibacter sp.]|nr:anti-sigma regulatory factor [Usitatibacter sp.]
MSETPGAPGIRAESREEIALRGSEDVVRLRQAVRDRAVTLGLSLVEQTKIITAASELGRNTLQYGGGGKAVMTTVLNGTRKGVRLDFIDQGPGIADIARALTDGYTSGGGLGLGLGGAKRLSDEFDIESSPGVGTRVSIVRWKPY